MNDPSQTTPDVLAEISDLKRRIHELEKLESRHKQMEETLRESESRMHTIADSSLDAILMMDTEGCISYWNPAAERILGYTSAEALDQKLHDLIAPSRYHEAHRATFPVFQKKGQGAAVGKTLNLEAIRKDGKKVSVELSLSSINIKGSWHAVGVLRDITERKRAEAALRESEERFRQIYEHMDVGVAHVSLDSRYVHLNKAFCQMLGYEEEELIGRHTSDIVQQEFVKENKLLQSQMAAGEIDHFRLEKGYVHKTGRIVYGILNSSLVRDPEGNPSYFLGSVVDITDRKQAEQERQNLQERLQRAEKMEAMGQLAGGVAHDLNNVLGVLSGYSELLLMEMPAGSRSRGHVEKILQSTTKGAAIIQDLLALARRGVTATEVVNLNAVVEGFFKTPVFENIKAYHPRVIFHTEFDQGLLNIKGSALHLEKTVMNLVSNAAEAISGVGEVAIRTENLYLDKPLRGYDEVKEGDYVVLTVSDTGMGIPAENIEKIFEPFYTKKKMGRSGTGLGLAIVWGTVKDNNGYIDVQSQVDEGTTFTLYFPVTREELTIQPQLKPLESYMGKGESVLVVDDIAEQREIATGLLEKLGYQVHAVSSGEEVVDYLRRNRADILVLDMIMTPGIDGLETYQRVLEINPRQKAIIVSGFSETDRAKEAQRLGAGAYVKKPYILEKVGMAIRNELNRK